VLQQLSAKTTEHLFPGNTFVLMIEGNYVKFSRGSVASRQNWDHSTSLFASSCAMRSVSDRKY